MKYTTLQELREDKYLPKAIRFINTLLHRSVLLRFIEINDWKHNTHPSVYISNKKNMFRYRKFQGFTENTIREAISFYNRELK